MRIRIGVFLGTEAVHRELDCAFLKNSYEFASPSQSEIEYSDRVAAQNSYASSIFPTPYFYARHMELADHFDSAQIFGLHGLNVVEKSTSARPDGGIYNGLNATNSDARLTVASILGRPLPSKDTTDLLLEEYFDSVHWFSLAIFDRFRPEYESVADGPADYLPDGDCNIWRVNLLSLLEARFLEPMEESSLASIQTSLLLGSYYVYHGRPNSSFALLCATIQTAQATDLHREPSRDALDEVEERKRIWWTIYTWDW
ncbi:hypothetical protein V1520DRAFT_281968 [Lipomyces starkeyi]|uniref:Xylanolytic transcriptional activator regulatory domain-containing protein n=1 Tax=Lipomyces starkeyi NRRL Y-11557 TaxID=675824 RepID=A0A1E3Q4C0_LIPST|nr:hypothetical protein LIPSTDRAFT_27899 [Lipomyces starkeyi NRRL Y-11557]